MPVCSRGSGQRAAPPDLFVTPLCRCSGCCFSLSEQLWRGEHHGSSLFQDPLLPAARAPSLCAAQREGEPTCGCGRPWVLPCRHCWQFGSQAVTSVSFFSLRSSLDSELTSLCQSVLEDFNLCLFYLPSPPNLSSVSEDEEEYESGYSFLPDLLIFRMVIICFMSVHSLRRAGERCFVGTPGRWAMGAGPCSAAGREPPQPGAG